MIAAFTHWGNASIIEAIWTLIGLVGIALAYHNLRDARKYLDAIDRLNGNRLKDHDLLAVIAFGHYRNEVLRMCVFSVISTVGVVAMITPPPSNNNHISATGLIVTAGLFVIGILEIAKSALDARQRAVLLHTIGNMPVSPS